MIVINKKKSRALKRNPWASPRIERMNNNHVKILISQNQWQNLYLDLRPRLKLDPDLEPQENDVLIIGQ
jgi:regulator of sirC expression with transglutaminase-like and TPR domain